MTPRTAREMQTAQCHAKELRDLLGYYLDPPELTRMQLMQAVGLATMARDALLRAAAARELGE